MRRNFLSAILAPITLAALAACAGDAETDGSAMDADTAAAAPAAVSLACAPTASGDDLAGRASPYDSVTFDVDGGQARICYSRPGLRGRTMIGGEAVPYGQLWRFGANEPTIIHLSTAATIAGLDVEPGSYSLYAIPQETGPWTLIVNRSTSQWGHEGQYTSEVEAQEVGRAEVEAESVEQPVEQFTIRAMEQGGGFIAEWQNSRIRVPVEPAG